ncbi:serine-threonine protein kinase, plant-type, putative [Ricinus communis]|uniref:Serine-threonine protein kinase, plant-type, putative n=1 Tax=Ricinus communis TaxID=3988 RepID=B9RG90_RICCO|nr:serine-threonine protein kinase, plant-type, putative [Ricinus communis]
MTSLRELDLSGNDLNSSIPSWLYGFSSLEFLNLAHNNLQGNSISGPIPLSIGDLKFMKLLDLSQNNLNKTLPLSFGELAELETVDHSYNSLRGDVSESHFARLTKLWKFDASGNQLRLRVDPNWSPPPYLYYLDLGSWNLGIASTIPFWFWNFSSNLNYLNISHNQIHGVIPQEQVREYSGELIDLSSNRFQGPLPYIYSNARALYLSNNSFSGPISKFLCHKMNELRFLEVLDLGDNHLSGELPDCWMSWDGLVVINLSNNNLSGTIPRSIGGLSRLESLHLRNNTLTGEIPPSLRNCTGLSTLDLGQNQLVGNIPRWIGETFPDMVILSLRSNKFQGDVPKKLCLMSSLYILDLADNNLSGTIPKCLNNFSAMVSRDDSIGMLLEGDASSWPFYESMFLVMKGKMDGYSSILKFVRSIDLSKNKLSGEIPEETISLKGLQSLNLSHNLLTGRIPTDIGDMESLESLDFSQNQLFGEIPRSMAKLTFLSFLNLSFNNLTGRIPTGTQLQSFSSFSFKGNKELCGPPVTMNCSGDSELPGTIDGRGDDQNGQEVNWFYVSVALGFVVGFWGAFGPLVLNRRWRQVYFRFLDSLWDKSWWRLM